MAVSRWRRMRRRSSCGRPASAACVLALTAGLAAAIPPSLAQQAPEPPAAATLTFDIPEQELNAALLLFADRSGLQLIYDVGLVEGLRSTPLTGSFTAEEGLTRLLSGSGITFRFSGANTVTLEPAEASEPIRLAPIVVQGEKIGRTLRETPASTRVLEGAEVNRPANRDLRDAIEGIPNVLAEEGARLPTIRGIDGSADLLGGPSFTTGAQPRVNVIVDGVPKPLTIGATPTISGVWDLDSLEVARGPQSTTTGRNSLGGAIRVATREPSFDYEAAARSTYFDQDGTFAGAVMVNLPVIEDQLALRVTAEVSEGESFVDVVDPALADNRNEVEDEEFRQFRGKLLLTPATAEDLEVLLSVERTETRRLFQPGLTDGDADPLEFSNFNDGQNTDINDQTVYAGRIRYDLSDSFQLEARAAFLDNVFEIPDTSPFFDYRQDTETVVTEGLLRFNDLGFVEKGVFGLAYESQNDDGDNPVAAFPLAVEGEIDNYGVFSEVEFGIIDKLVLIAGGRVEIDRRERLVTFAGDGSEASSDDLAFIPKIGLRYDVTTELVLGYTYAEGFRPGGVDFEIRNPAAGASEFDSERLRQHEIYARSRFLDGRLQLNGSAFYYEFDDAQVLGAGSTTATLVGNVPEARGFGLELEGAFEIYPGLTLTGGLGLLDTEITDAGSVAPQFEGEELPRAPNIMANGGLGYVSDFGFTARVAARYVGSAPDAIGGPNLDSYVVVDLAVGYDLPIGDQLDLRFEAFVDNVGDERYVTDIAPSFSGRDLAVVGRPRTFGLAATVRF